MKRAGIAFVLAAAAAAVLCFFVFRERDPTPRLERAVFEAAYRRWKQSDLPSYDLDLLVEGDGSLRERYRVEVRGGKVVRFLVDGRETPPGTSGEHYTVAGLLNVIERELEMSSRPPAQGAPRRADLRAEFDPERGYPRVFKRFAPGSQSRIIRVERLEPRGP